LFAAKRAAVNRLEARDDALLQRKEIRTCRGKIHRERQSTTRSGAARQRAKADVRAKLHTVEMNGGNRAVRRTLRLSDRIAERAHAENTPAVDDDLFVDQRRAGMKDAAIGIRFFRYAIEPADYIALARIGGIPGRRKNDTETRAPVPFRLRLTERSGGRVREQIQQIGFEPHENRLRFRVAKTAVEFEHTRIAAPVDHDARV